MGRIYAGAFHKAVAEVAAERDDPHLREVEARLERMRVQTFIRQFDSFGGRILTEEEYLGYLESKARTQ